MLLLTVIYCFHRSWSARFHVWDCLAVNISGMGTAVFFRELYCINYLLRNNDFEPFERKGNQPFRNK